MSPTLVTGASGLIGSALVEAVTARGEEVVALTRDPAGARIDARAQLVVGDIADAALLARAIRRHRVDTVFHLAAQTIAGDAQRDPATTYATNIAGTTALLDAALGDDVRRVVVASSVTAYGPAATPPYTEDMEPAPTNPYDISKAAVDLAARAYWPAHGLPVATIRLTNVYGGVDRNGSRLIPELVTAALDGRPPRLRTDGTPQRDFLHRDDAVAAYLAIADALEDHAAAGQAFNAGLGRPVAVREVADTLARVLGRPIDVQYAPATGERPSIQYVSHAKLTALTGWTPAVDLEDGLARTVAAYRAARARLAA
jgi:CDP-glucose 4,6-dehydratase